MAKKLKYVKPKMKFNPGAGKYDVDLGKVKKKEKYCDFCGEGKKDQEECSCKKEKPLKVYFCPKCKSTDVGFVFRFQNIFGLLPKIECKKCNYKSGMFPLLVIPKSKLDKMNKKGKKK
jgi:hypothetical protein